MKRFKIIILPILCYMLIINCMALDFENNIFNYHDEHITVTFDEGTTLSHARQYYIADCIVNSAHVIKMTDPQALSWCWLFGHDITIHSVSAVHHKVAPYSPRCLREIYEVKTCSNCDYNDITLISSYYIACCSND